MGLTNAERQARHRARIAARLAGLATPAPAKRSRPVNDRLSRPQRWQNAVQALSRILDEYEQWQTNLPETLAGSRLAELLDETMELRELVDQLAAAKLPIGFGRD